MLGYLKAVINNLLLTENVIASLYNFFSRKSYVSLHYLFTLVTLPNSIEGAFQQLQILHTQTVLIAWLSNTDALSQSLSVPVVQ